MVAYFIKTLINTFSVKTEDIQLMGHSLGAHVSGFAGKRFNETKIGLITALDPAGPGFNYVRLAPSDANLVTAVHTSAGITKEINVFMGDNLLESVQLFGFLGNSDSLAHFDFWPNSGNGQPGCEKISQEFLNEILLKGGGALKERASCDHSRAHELPTAEQALRQPDSCQMIGYECDSYLEFKAGECLSEHCFDELGCFESRDFVMEERKYFPHLENTINAMKNDKFKLWNNQMMICPVNPEHSDVEFKLFTPDSNHSVAFTYRPDPKVLKSTSFSPDRKTLFIVHGYVDGYKGCDDYGSCHWMERIKNYFIAYDYNVIAVDWHKPAASLNYFYSAFNTRIIGAMIANFIKTLVQVFSYKPSDIQLMGHSLGGQIMGFVGKHFNETNKKIGFISGLDPAGPGFDTYSLEHTDADLVIAVHTSAGLLKAVDMSDLLSFNPLEVLQLQGYTGSVRNIGDFDLWLNGGNGQPGCDTTSMNFLKQAFAAGPGGLADNMACSHMRATEIPSAERVLREHRDEKDTCQWVAYECSNYIDFLHGQCYDCGQDGKKCKLLEYMPGYWLQPKNLVDIKKGFPQNLYLQTQAMPPYCLYHYMIVLHMSEVKYVGRIKFTLNGRKKVEFEKPFELKSKDPKTYNFLYTDSDHLGQITEMTIEYHKTIVGSLVKYLQILRPMTFIQSMSANEITISAIDVIFMSHIDQSVRDSYSSQLIPNTKDMSGKGFNFIINKDK
ncbi:unnamed protein product [Oppiella nova]|uniref:Lipase domain-containing protein n=1 Tax=Oppiella nova TaxID=334625 RepID=A0A7R9QSE7_9ACAR|nr:unnamed protein product [Oppiella nova]CAG2173289.1 unnamed protein product [Oppiella nova]